MEVERQRVEYPVPLLTMVSDGLDNSGCIDSVAQVCVAACTTPRKEHWQCGSGSNINAEQGAGLDFTVLKLPVVLLAQALAVQPP